MSDVPPVTTAPAVAASWNPARPNSRARSVKISSTRGWMISERTWRESWRGFRPPTDGTSTVSSAGTSAVSAHPYRFFMSSAEGDGVRRCERGVHGRLVGQREHPGGSQHLYRPVRAQDGHRG